MMWRIRSTGEIFHRTAKPASAARNKTQASQCNKLIDIPGKSLNSMPVKLNMEASANP